jgi:murein DD-endopeptidase MepM/ murein hydrolase activator NlpD
MRSAIVAIISAFLLISCRHQEVEPINSPALGALPPQAAATEVANLPRPARLSEPTATPTATATPLPTPTPTATAQPVFAAGDPRSLQMSEPVSQSGAPCGLVDVFDFPVNPPDGLPVARGGTDFGAFRSRYGLYHSGEDWWPYRGQSSFGEPVFAIGHGQVTYAAPNGWGRDQGVLILQHTFADGSKILSFYGHLDPPSVTLRSGECVRRGDQVGDIGRPRTTPHLHFEIRTHMPNEPGPGYWFEDPTLAGWFPPSETIWYRRLVAAAGVLWAQPTSEPPVTAIGILDDRVLLGLKGGKLVTVGLASGRTLWQDRSDSVYVRAVLDSSRPILYATNGTGNLVALPLDFLLAQSPGPPQTTPEPLWRSSARFQTTSTLLPLPAGGLVVANWNRTAALSQEGRVLWEGESVGRSFDWLLAGEMLIVSTTAGSPSTWTLDAAGAWRWMPDMGGPLAISGDRVYVYDQAGIYRLNLDDRTADLLYPLSLRFMSSGDMVALPDGGLLIAHRDLADQRLLLLEQDGSLRWERSLSRAVNGEMLFVSAGQRLYLLARHRQESTEQLSLYDLNPLTAALTLIFVDGPRAAVRSEYPALTTTDGQMLFTVGTGRLVLFDAGQAVDRAHTSGQPTRSAGDFAGAG